MKNIIIKIITFISIIVVIITSGMQLFKDFRIPGLAPISMAIMMACLIYSMKQQMDKQVGELNHKNVIIIAAIALVGNLFAGILEIIKAL